MKKNRSITLGIALVLLASIGSFAYIVCAPTSVFAKKPSPPLITVTIGDIAASTEGLLSAQAIADIAVDDINNYFTILNEPYRLQVDVQDAQGRSDTHQTLVVDFNFRPEPVNLLLAGRWSAQAQMSLPYCDAFNMLMLSPSSTSTYFLSAPDDNLFRLCPSDAYQGVSLAHVVWSKGIEHVVLIQRSDAWGDGMFIHFTKEYAALGGSLTGKPVRYPAEGGDFTEYLDAAEDQVATAIDTYGASKVGVVLVAFNEASNILNLAKSDYSHLYGCTWFGTDGTTRNQYIINEAGEAAAHVKLYGLLPKENHGPNWGSVASRYTEKTGQPLAIYQDNEYDIFWIYALSIEKAKSADPMAVKKVLPSIAANYQGISGYCGLNQYGDRLNPGFDIWGYIEGAPQFECEGSVDVENNVTWLP